MLAILTESFISLGAEFYTIVVFDSTLSLGLTKLIGGVCFSLGLIIVTVAGAELFTGN
jgi:formate transporter